MNSLNSISWSPIIIKFYEAFWCFCFSRQTSNLIQLWLLFRFSFQHHFGFQNFCSATHASHMCNIRGQFRTWMVVYHLVQLSPLRVYLHILFRYRSIHEQLKEEPGHSQTILNCRFPKLFLSMIISTFQFLGLYFSFLKQEGCVCSQWGGEGWRQEVLSYLTLLYTSCDYACITAQAVGTQRWKMESGLPLPS